MCVCVGFFFIYNFFPRNIQTYETYSREVFGYQNISISRQFLAWLMLTIWMHAIISANKISLSHQSFRMCLCMCEFFLSMMLNTAQLQVYYMLLHFSPSIFILTFQQLTYAILINQNIQSKLKILVYDDSIFFKLSLYLHFIHGIRPILCTQYTKSFFVYTLPFKTLHRFYINQEMRSTSAMIQWGRETRTK